MRKLLITLMLVFAGVNLAYAGHAYDAGGYHNIARAAHQLENAAWGFHEQLRYGAGRDHATRDAKRFAKAARHFHRQVERGRNYRHIQRDYAKLASAYAHARNELGGRHDLHHERHLRGSFRDVERAFDDLNRSIQYARSRYSRSGEDHRFGRGGDGYGYYRQGYDRESSGWSITLEGVFGS